MNCLVLCIVNLRQERINDQHLKYLSEWKLQMISINIIFQMINHLITLRLNAGQLRNVSLLFSVRGATWNTVCGYYRALLIWQVCNEQKHNKKMNCSCSSIFAFVFIKKEFVMKTDFDCLKVDPNDINTIYRYHAGISFGSNFLPQIEDYVEDIVVEQIPFDGEVYFVPVVFRDVNGNEARGLSGFNTLFQTTNNLDYIIEADGSLISLDDSTLLDIENSIDVEFLIQPEGFDPELKEHSETFPDSVTWEDFHLEAALQNVGYAFELIDSTPLDMDLELFRMQKVLAGEIDEDDEIECTGAYTPVYVLHKVFLTSLPKVGHIFYIPVEINFNEKQQRNGYAFFDAQRQQVLDVHFYDRNHGQVSAMFTSPVLEDCGLFKDEELFNYKILLSNC